MSMRRVLDRRISSLLTAGFQRRHWRVLGNLRDVDPAAAFLVRYLSQRGSYPFTVTLSTPCGDVRPVLYSRHDLLTVNEVFLRRDYGDGEGVTHILDIGANIGLAALFWLTRSEQTQLICYEPDPRNVERLRATLVGFEDRYQIVETAVVGSGDPRLLHFQDEASGRYGAVNDSGPLVVAAEPMAAVLAAAHATWGAPIDLVKLDVEGLEQELVDAIPRDAPVRAVLAEFPGEVRRLTFGEPQEPK